MIPAETSYETIEIKKGIQERKSKDFNNRSHGSWLNRSWFKFNKENKASLRWFIHDMKKFLHLFLELSLLFLSLWLFIPETLIFVPETLPFVSETLTFVSETSTFCSWCLNFSFLRPCIFVSVAFTNLFLALCLSKHNFTHHCTAGWHSVPPTGQMAL